MTIGQGYTRVALTALIFHTLARVSSAFLNHGPATQALPLGMTFLSAPVSHLLGSGDEFDQSIDSGPTYGGDDVPPLPRDLIQKATSNYIYGTSLQPITQDRLRLAIEQGYHIRNHPVTIVGSKFEGEVSRVLSFAVLHHLPSEITVELLSGEDPRSLQCRALLLEHGWSAVHFPNGLALRPKSSRRWPVRRSSRVAQAQLAVEQAAAAIAPTRQLEKRQEFLAAIEDTLSEPTRFPDPGFPFFPNNVPLSGVSWQRFKRALDRKYATFKAKGRAGILGYAIFNFTLYSVGMVWQWRRIVPADPHNGVGLVLLRKLGRVFGSMYVLSNILKIPKLLSAVALAPLSERLLAFVKRKLNVDDNTATAVLMGSMVALWTGIMSVPLTAEYIRLRRLVLLDKLVEGYLVQPV